MSEEEIKEQPKTEELINNFIKCPCCGKFTLEKPLKLNSALIDQWLACMLTAVPFSHTYPVYDGKIKVTVTQLDPAADDMLSDFRVLLDGLLALPWDKDMHPACPVNIDHLKGALYTYSSITEVSMALNEASRSFKPSAAVLASFERFKELRTGIMDGTLLDKDSDMAVSIIKKGYDTVFNQANISSLPLAMLMAVVETHNRIVMALMDNGFDSNFWQGIELG